MSWVSSIEKYKAYNEQEEKDKELILQAAKVYDNLLSRDNNVMHMTSSAYIVNKNRDKVLMIYHKLYDSWAWVGGHADGEEDLLKVALKEAQEETGAKNIKVVSHDIFSIEVLGVNGHIKRGSYVSTHLHLNVTYLLEVDEEERLIVNEEETNGVKWIDLNSLKENCSEAYMVEAVYNKLNEKIKNNSL